MWQSRCITAVAIFLLQELQKSLFGNSDQTDIGALIYYGSAAMADMVIVYLISFFLDGKLLSDIQYINLASICANFIGWILYMAYLPPTIYDVLIKSLLLVQWIRLIWTDNNVNPIGHIMVRSDNISREKFYY